MPPLVYVHVRVFSRLGDADDNNVTKAKSKFS